MGRSRKKPEYNPEIIQQEMIDISKELYQGKWCDFPDKKTNTLRAVAEELDISIAKVVKLLITGGVYMPKMAKRVNELHTSGQNVNEIQRILGVSRATVQSYLPYKKGIYSAKETSVNADRIRMYRERCRCLEVLQDDLTEEALWQAVVLFQEYPFYTSSGLPFSYVLKEGRDGTPNKELMVSRRQESKTLAWSSVCLAFEKAMEMQGLVVERPKALGDIRGISYIYPMLYRFGLIEVPEKTAEKMGLKGGAGKRA